MIIQLESVQERDADFVLVHIFAEHLPAMKLFIDAAGLINPQVLKIWHSKMDPASGESDVEVLLEEGGKKHCILIENKIDAPAMPNQYARYVERANKGLQTGAYHTYTIIMTAPERYLNRNLEASKYPHRISYEAILSEFEHCINELDAAVIRQAIQSAAKPYEVQEVVHITEFWHKFYNYCQKSSYHVEMFPVKGAKGSRSAWFQFKNPLHGTALYFKAPTGTVDWEFTGKLSERIRIKEALKNFLESDMYWVEAGKSLILRIRVDSVDVNKQLETQTKEIDTMLRAMERMHRLSVTLFDLGNCI